MTEAEPATNVSSEDLVKQESVSNSRPLFQLLITRSVESLNRKFALSDRSSLVGTEGFTEFRSFKDANTEIKRIRMNQGIQSSALTSDKASQSSWSRKVNSSSQTSPLSLLSELSKAIEEQDEYLKYAQVISDRLSTILESNITSDVFSDQLASLIAKDDSLVKSFSVSQMKESLSLKDARFNNSVQCIDWMPGTVDTVGISFASTSNYVAYLDYWPSGKIEYIFIWNFQSILHPQYVLESPSVVKVFKFCPNNPNIIAAGCESGQVLIYDLSDKATQINADLRSHYGSDDSFSTFYHAKFASAFFGNNLQPTKAHSQPICDLHWFPEGQKLTRVGDFDTTEKTTQFVTCGLEGRLVIWDVNIDVSFVHPNIETLLPGASLVNEMLPSFTINVIKNPKNPVFIPIRCFHLCEDQNKLLNGDIRLLTDDGFAASFNWITGGDRSLAAKQNPNVTLFANFLFHTALGFQHSPFLDGLYLACDRSHVVLASMKNSVEELFRSSARSHTVLCVAFSPRRPSVFVVGKENGEIEVWSLLDKSHECLFCQSVASSKIQCIKFATGKNERQLLCIGCGDGTLLIYKVPLFMSKPVANELEQMEQFVKIQLLFAAQTEKRMQARKDQASRAKSQAAPADAPPEST